MLNNIDRYWRTANYLTLAQIYLKDNVLLQRRLSKNDLKDHYKGHWGTSPGINFIYAHLNYYIKKYAQKVHLVVGPGHAGCALLSNIFIEGSISDYYSGFENNLEGLNKFLSMEKHVKGIRSEINPFYPGTIYDGGELGYSLPVAFASVFDSPNSMAVCVIGDGEAETGTISSSWNCINYLDEKSGFVLPIIHLNNFKMGSRSLMSRKSDEELKAYFYGLGYETKIVLQSHQQMISALDWVYESHQNIRQGKTRRWPLIILRTPKGWTAPFDEEICIENRLNSHKIPLSDVKSNQYSFDYLEKWLQSYRPHELFNEDGSINCETMELIPSKKLKLGKDKFCLQKLKTPSLDSFMLKDKSICNNISILNKYIKAIISKNYGNFRIMSPDELASNGLGELLFESNGEKSFSNERVIEILNENICQAWMQGYNLTGRNSLMISYEAFMPIITSMVSQYAKYLIQLSKVEWRNIKPSMNYLLSSLCWANTYSHQNPEFINALISQENSFVRIYFPIDANNLLSCIDLSLQSQGQINVIIASKRESAQWLDMKMSIQAAHEGVLCWDWLNPKTISPDIVLAAAGNYSLNEALEAIKELKNRIPKLKIKFVSVIELTTIGSPEIYPHALSQEKFENIFTQSAPVIFHFHGYPSIIKALMHERTKERELSIFGFNNLSYEATSTLGKMILNNCSRYHICLRANQIAFDKCIIEQNIYEDNKKYYEDLIKKSLVSEE